MKAVFNVFDQKPDIADMEEEVLSGLSRPQKTIPPKYFYDEKGSQLFDAITRQPEYYPTRTETRILKDSAKEIANIAGDNCFLIEYGSGSSEKIRVLLDAIQPVGYMPLDISKEYLIDAAKKLQKDYPWLDVHAVCVDYSQDWDMPYEPEDARKVAFFPGSSIGNFHPSEALAFMRRVRHAVGDKGGFLVGVDMKKEIAVLNDAYNDEAGVTAAFNLNVLHHINHRLDAGINVDKFGHQALYNEKLGRVEMYLIAQDQHEVELSEQLVQFAKGEKIHTENSYKYHVQEFAELAAQADFKVDTTWMDEDELFAVIFLAAA